MLLTVRELNIRKALSMFIRSAVVTEVLSSCSLKKRGRRLWKVTADVSEADPAWKSWDEGAQKW